MNEICAVCVAVINLLYLYTLLSTTLVTFSHVTVNCDLWPWPSTTIWTSMPYIYGKGHFNQKLPSRQYHTHMHTPDQLSRLSSNRHDRSNDDCLEGKKENYQVCSVQYCAQQLCTMQCRDIWTDLTVVCWLDLQFICVRFSFWGLFYVIVYLCICAFVVRFSFCSTMPRDWLGRTSPKWPILCLVGCKTSSLPGPLK